MNIDPRTPVVVGVAQDIQKPDDLTQALEAIVWMEQISRAALDDSGSATLINKLDHVGAVQGAWKYEAPARMVADALGASNATTSVSPNGGNAPQSYMNWLAGRIKAGEINCALFCGAETIWTRRRQRRAEIPIPYTDAGQVEPDVCFGDDVAMQTDFEQARGVSMPIHFYPMFDSAIRHSRGESIDEHRDRISRLWHRFNEQAVANPYAWSRTPMTADEIREPSPTNRMVGFPYTKAMNSNWDLDQAAAVVVCSAETAEAAGVPRDRWVFAWAGTDAHDTYSVSHRRDLHSSPAITEAGRELFSLAGVGPDDVNHIDLYSCFPSAVQVGAESLGFSEDRLFTQTGGLTFAGGPLNNYVTHSIATMVEVLRNDAGSLGLVSANGGMLTKHALGLYSTEPPARDYAAVNVQEAVDQVPVTAVAEDHTGDVTVEAYTVMHNADGIEEALCALKTDDGARTWGRVTDVVAAEHMMAEEAIGRAGHLDASGTLQLS